MGSTVKKIALLSGGGDCPGLNAVIRTITKTAISKYGYEVIGFVYGYRGLYHNNYVELTEESVEDIYKEGGTILYSSNKDNLFDYLVDDGHGGKVKKDVYDVPSVTIVEVMGRNAGWLTAASALARIEGRKVPQLIYLCEKAFDEDQFIKDVNEALKKENNIIIAVSEGVKTADGNYVGEETKSGKEDVFGHKYLSGVGKYLEGLVGEKIGCKVRSVELNILQRCAGYMLSETDIMESRNLGAFAAVSAIRGKSGKMSAVRRISDDPYQVEIVLSDLSKIANYEKKVPMEWINEEGNDIKDELLTYLKPLIQGEVQIPYENGIPKRFIL